MDHESGSQAAQIGVECTVQRVWNGGALFMGVLWGVQQMPIEWWQALLARQLQRGRLL